MAGASSYVLLNVTSPWLGSGEGFHFWCGGTYGADFATPDVRMMASRDVLQLNVHSEPHQAMVFLTFTNYICHWREKAGSCDHSNEPMGSI